LMSSLRQCGVRRYTSSQDFESSSLSCPCVLSFTAFPPQYHAHAEFAGENTQASGLSNFD
jgi:hypothetical protein